MTLDEYKLLRKINSPRDLKQLSAEELRTYCDELRSYIIDECSVNPGHLASSLGCVELAAALHYVFDTPADKIVWDVGHQTYAHKIITGRREAFKTKRLLGGISGVLIARSKLPAFIATLGMMKILRSVTQQVMQTAAVKVPSSFLAISNTKIGGEVILPILYWLVAAVILHIVSRYTPFGRHVYAVGSNERTARLSGVNVERVKGLIYVLMGALVAVTAVIQVSRIGSMDYANAGSGYEMDAIAAVVVGGTSMSGGRGSILGTVLGMLIIAVMNNLLNLMGVPPFLREAFKGFIVIAAVLLQKKEAAA